MTASPRRVEDGPLVRGRGCYLDDLRPDGLVHAAFVRSPVAHGRLTALDVSEAESLPGVIGIYVGSDLGLDRPMPNMYPSPLLADSVQGHPLAPDELCYVGEPVAVVVAENRYVAADAVSAVFADTSPLAACVDHRFALEPDAPSVHDGRPSNLVTTLAARYGDADVAFGAADHVVAVSLTQHRGAAASIEPRGVLADPSDGRLSLWSSTQSPHKVRDLVAGYFGLGDLRVVAPDVGGGFGPKGAAYAEEYVLPAIARHIGRPVKWVEGRREHFLTTHQQRDQTYTFEVAFDNDGRLRGVRGRVIHDNGAYIPYGALLPMTGLNLIPGPYLLEAFDVTIDVVYTNLVPTSPIRGAGRPNAVFAMERCVDTVARTLGLSPVEVRRRNFVPAGVTHTLPLLARGGEPIRYDGGDYQELLTMALDAAGTAGFSRRRDEAAARGMLAGVGVASYVEDTGLGPAEGARVSLTSTGGVAVAVGVASQGQGHATVIAQLAAQALGVRLDEVDVTAGDTDTFPTGISTVASRTAVTAMPAVRQAAEAVAGTLREMVAEWLEASPADIVLAGGRAEVVGQPGAAITLAEVVDRASASGRMGDLDVTAEVPFGMAAYAAGSHVAEVEIDPETGAVAVVAYTVSHDCGRVLNPMIVAGQIDGGVVHGLGNALSERIRHDDDGQPLVTTFVDYRIMSAPEVPPIVKVHTETPSDTNSLGAKGAGEGGTLPAMAAVVAAVEDALSDFGVVVDRYPLEPQTVLGLMRG